MDYVLLIIIFGPLLLSILGGYTFYYYFKYLHIWKSNSINNSDPFVRMNFIQLIRTNKKEYSSIKINDYSEYKLQYNDISIIFSFWSLPMVYLWLMFKKRSIKKEQRNEYDMSDYMEDLL